MQGATILIVDDDQGLGRLIERILKREGLQASVTLSGEQALEWSASHRADLMLIDLKLPDLEAHDLIERLGKDGHSPPFVIITGEGDERVAVDMMKRGALDYLVKDAQFLDLVPIVVRRTLTHLSSSRKLALSEARLQKEHAFSDAVLETSGALMLVVDASGRIARFNQSCERLTEYSFGEVRGRPFSEVFLSAPEQESSVRMLQDILNHPGSKESEGYMLTRRGERRLISWSLTTLLSDDRSAVEFIVASGMDITERRQLERDILEVSEHERKRIGQDLHDGLCQVLAGIDMLATVLHKKLTLNSPADTKAAGDISRYAREAIDQARMLARGLSPVELEANGLISALRELTAITSKIFNIRCTFVCDQSFPETDSDRSTHLYRIVQESINNALKHGAAKVIEVVLSMEEEAACLSITDDGVGFKLEGPTATGMGLRSMRHRGAMIHGSVEVLPGTSRGAVVRCTFPLKSNSTAADR